MQMKMNERSVLRVNEDDSLPDNLLSADAVSALFPAVHVMNNNDRSNEKEKEMKTNDENNQKHSEEENEIAHQLPSDSTNDLNDDNDDINDNDTDVPNWSLRGETLIKTIVIIKHTKEKEIVIILRA